MPNRSSPDDKQYYSSHQYSSTALAPQMMSFFTLPSDGTSGGADRSYVNSDGRGFTGYYGAISYGDTHTFAGPAGTDALRYNDPILCPGPSNASTAGQRAYQTLGNAPASPALGDADDPVADIDSMVNYDEGSDPESASTQVDQEPTAVYPSRGKHSAQHSRDVKQPRPASRPSRGPNFKRPKPKRLRTADFLDRQSPFTQQHFTQDPTSPLALTKIENASTTSSSIAYGTYPTASSPGYHQIVGGPGAEDDSVFTEE